MPKPYIVVLKRSCPDRGGVFFSKALAETRVGGFSSWHPPCAQHRDGVGDWRERRSRRDQKIKMAMHKRQG
jgi:hypothetical protein